MVIVVKFVLKYRILMKWKILSSLGEIGYIAVSKERPVSQKIIEDGMSMGTYTTPWVDLNAYK